MAIKNYSLLIGNVTDYKTQEHNQSPHFEVKIKSKNIYYQISINVRSSVTPHELKYMVTTDVKHPLISKLKVLSQGMHKLDSTPNSIALDYIRSNLFDIEKMKTLPHTQPGPNNDLNELLLMYVKRAKNEKDALVFAFGEKWPPKSKLDRYFGFLPGQGIHDIHMNQGNSGKWKSDNGIYQDGGLFFYFPGNKQWVGVFLAFQSQAIHTDDVTGNPIEIPTHFDEENKELRIVAALVNPEGKETGNESVTIMNISNKDISLSGWFLLDANKKAEPLPDVTIKAGDTYRFLLSGKSAQLSNKGGQITLLSPDKLKVHGLAYTKNQVEKQGWSVLF